MESLGARSAVSSLVAFAVAFLAYKRKSLDLSGALAGFLVMAIHLTAGFRFGAMILVFFITSSMLTKLGEEHKRKIEEEFKEGGQRNWLQVLANAGIATVLVVIVGTLTNWRDQCLDSQQSAIVTALIGSIIGHYACCNGDTWSSELGMLSKEQPRLITTFKPVRKGTNGGVTRTGLLAAALAGSVIGLTFVLFGLLTATCSTNVVGLKQLWVLPLATFAGLCGSLIDSLLGATLEFSGFCTVRNKVVSKRGPTVKKISGIDCLDNNAVNLISILITTLLTGLASSCIF